MQNLNDIVTYQSHNIEQILVSDLHLPLSTPASNTVENVLGQAFLHLLDICIELPNLKQFYILGDWFEAWLGDDVADTPDIQIALAPMLDKLKKLQQKNCDIRVMVGNRDFLLGQKFCDKFGGMLIHEPYFIDLENQKIRLEHGDLLCTDDKKYQRFRKVIQNPLTKKLLLALPIQKRAQIAHKLRQKSRQDTNLKAQKSKQIMDVNATAVQAALRNSDILLHGHTHRPAVYMSNDKQRIVLGDWRLEHSQVIAEIAIVVQQQLQLVTLQFPLG